MKKGFLAAMMALVAGCSSASVDGTVDAQEIDGARDAIWDEFEVDLPFGGGSYSLTQIWIADFPDSCEVRLALDDVDDDAEDCEELCDGYLKVIDDFDLDPELHWALYLSVNTSDGALGEFDYAEIPEDEEFNALFSFLQGEDLVDSSACESACEDNELLGDADDSEFGEDGTLTLDEVDDGELPGEFLIEFGGADVLEGSFRAEPCDLDELSD